MQQAANFLASYFGYAGTLAIEPGTTALHTESAGTLSGLASIARYIAANGTKAKELVDNEPELQAQVKVFDYNITPSHR
jgi:hypothetical protein